MVFERHVPCGGVCLRGPANPHVGLVLPARGLAVVQVHLGRRALLSRERGQCCLGREVPDRLGGVLANDLTGPMTPVVRVLRVRRDLQPTVAGRQHAPVSLGFRDCAERAPGTGRHVDQFAFLGGLCAVAGPPAARLGGRLAEARQLLRGVSAHMLIMCLGTDKNRG